MESHRDDTGSRLGMWLFLFTEILLFGGLFILYASYFAKYRADFTQYGQQLDTVLGTVNTVILLLSSFTVACSITAIRRGARGMAVGLLLSSIGLALVFLVNKYFEWGHKIHLGIYPGSPTLAEGPPGQNIFYGLYYVITGLHGIHVIVGMILLGVVAVLVHKGRITSERYVFQENGGLYWHLVDLLWIFIFPLFYLVP